jgi:hypothetical protein
MRTLASEHLFAHMLCQLSWRADKAINIPKLVPCWLCSPDPLSCADLRVAHSRVQEGLPFYHTDAYLRSLTTHNGVVWEFTSSAFPSH